MKHPAVDPSEPIAQIGELAVSGPALREMIQAVLQTGRPFRFKAAGTSMSPFIKNGDVLTIRPLSSPPPAFGDVVACIHPDTNKTVVHRLIGRQNRRYLVKGDNTRTLGALLPLKDILGCVTKVERNGRHVDWGLGPERRLIALFSRWRLLLLILSFLQRLRRHPVQEQPYD
ncbi:MAG: S24/S26 family peptidase [Thermodesulfobacteriota bacterium]